MKLSLKEFFLREGGNYKSSTGGSGGAKSSHAHGASGKKSSTNIQVNIGEAGPGRPFVRGGGLKNLVKKMSSGRSSSSGEEKWPGNITFEPEPGDWCEVCNQTGGNPECKYCRDAEKQMDRGEYFGSMEESGEEKWPGNITFEPEPEDRHGGESVEFDFDVTDDINPNFVKTLAKNNGVDIVDYDPLGVGGGNPQYFAVCGDPADGKRFLTYLYDKNSWSEVVDDAGDFGLGVDEPAGMQPKDNDVYDDTAQFGTHIPDMPHNPYKNEGMNEAEEISPEYRGWLNQILSTLIFNTPSNLRDKQSMEQFSKYVREEGPDSFQTGVSPKEFISHFFGGGLEEEVRGPHALANWIEQQKYGSSKGGPKGFHRKVVKALKNKNEGVFGSSQSQNGGNSFYHISRGLYDMGLDSGDVEKIQSLLGSEKENFSDDEVKAALVKIGMGNSALRALDFIHDQERRNESLEEAQNFQLPLNLLREFQHVPPVPRPGATAWSSPSEPVTVKKFFNKDGNLGIDLQGKRSSKMNEAEGDDPFGREEGDLGDDLSWLDDPNLGKDVGPIQKAEPRGSKASKAAPEKEPDLYDKYPNISSPITGPETPPPDEEFDMTWDEYRASHPEEAQDLEMEMGGSPRGATFAVRSGFTHMLDPEGKRWKHTEASGWLPMDDGHTPAGEF